MTMNKILTSTIRAALFLAAVTLISATAHAQSTAFWTNSAGGEWNIAANWNVDLSGFNAPPAEGTNADIGSQGPAVVSYDLPMAATSFGVLNLAAGSPLSVNTNGFNLNAGGAATALITIGGTAQRKRERERNRDQWRARHHQQRRHPERRRRCLHSTDRRHGPAGHQRGRPVECNPRRFLSGTGAVDDRTGAGLRLVVSGGSMN